MDSISWKAETKLGEDTENKNKKSPRYIVQNEEKA